MFVGLGLDWNLNLFRNSWQSQAIRNRSKENDEQLAQLKQGLKLRAESSP
ncbi:MAG: hypothetical protein R3A12_11175 [Ignavibacteria bacterium]